MLIDIQEKSLSNFELLDRPCFLKAYNQLFYILKMFALDLTAKELFTLPSL